MIRERLEENVKEIFHLSVEAGRELVDGLLAFSEILLAEGFNPFYVVGKVLHAVPEGSENGSVYSSVTRHDSAN